MQVLPRFDPHNHTEYSNLRLVDCINRVPALIDRAIELGLSGIAITDHECLSAHVKANQYAQKIVKEHPDFKIALGNEIYLCPNREKGQKYYHFILVAKNKQGYQALKVLSTRAWMNSFVDRRMERVITTYDDLIEICGKYPNSLVATSACLGGELSAQTLLLIEAEKLGDKLGAEAAHNDIVNFILFCQRVFGKDFYIECAPGCSKDQIAVNRRLLSISKCFNIPMVIGCDSHFLKKEDRYIHKAFLNSKEGEREVDAFYEYSYLQSNEEIIEHLQKSSFDELYVKEMFNNSYEINTIKQGNVLKNMKNPREVFKFWLDFVYEVGYDSLVIKAYLKDYTWLSVNGYDIGFVWIVICVLLMFLIKFLIKKIYRCFCGTCEGKKKKKNIKND